METEKLKEKLERLNVLIKKSKRGQISLIDRSTNKTIKRCKDVKDIEEFILFYDRVKTMEELNSLGGL